MNEKKSISRKSERDFNSTWPFFKILNVQAELDYVFELVSPNTPVFTLQIRRHSLLTSLVFTHNF